MSEEKRQPKTKEELQAIKEEVETLSKKLAELTEEELAQVSGGNSGSTFTYEVVSGDSLSDIAMRFGTTVATLMALNKDLITNPDVIKVGWKLRVPENTKKSGWM